MLLSPFYLCLFYDSTMIKDNKKLIEITFDNSGLVSLSLSSAVSGTLVTKR